MTYNQLINFIEDEDNEEDLCRFKYIVDHQGPFEPTDINYKGSKWNVKVMWESGDSTYEPLSLIEDSDPITCSLYGEKKNLLNMC